MAAFLSELYAAILPLILTAIAALLAQIIAGAAKVAKERWGIEVEARHRDALHSALMSGVRAALSRGLTGRAAVDSAVAYATKSVPDALARLGPSSEVLSRLATSKLREAQEKLGFAVGGVSKE